MFSILKKISLVALFLCLLPAQPWAQVKISPDIVRLLTITARQDNGVNLDIVANMAIAANPAGKKRILQLVKKLKQQKQPAPVMAQTVTADVPKVADAQVTTTDAPKTIASKIVPKHYSYFDLDGWDGEVDLNFLRSSGNTSQNSVGLGGSLERNTENYHHLVTTYFDYNRNSGVTDKQRWGLSYKLDYDLAEKAYITSLAGYENDKYGTFRERVITSLGMGYHVITNETYSWKLEAGPSMLYTKEHSGDSYDATLNAFTNSLFKWTINERSKLTNNTIFYFGDQTIIESKTALKVKINGALSSKFSYDILYDQTAPVDRKRTDTVTRAGLTYDF